MTTAKDVIRQNLGAADQIMETYLKDLTDDDLLVVPVEGMNPIAWQLGHILFADRYFTETIKPGSSPPMPERWEQAHGKEMGAPNAFKKVATKDEYIAALKAQRAATLAVLDALPDDQLDTPTGVPYAPTFGAMLNIIGGHALGHLGQFVAVRRKLGKPVVM